MSEFRTITPEEFSGNPFTLIGRDWMLVTAANPGDGLRGGEDYNTMTASWGGMGILWGKPVAFVFVRPQRHTFSFTEKNDRLTLSFFGPEYREARLVLLTRKLYAKPFDPEAFLDRGSRDMYPKDDFHTVYVCEIEKILEKT